MSDWGAIAGGFNQGMQQNVRTIGELQHMNLLKEKAEREKNVFDVWKKQEAEKAKPVYTNRLKETLDPEVYEVGYKRALTAGVINNPGTEFEHIPAGRLEEFMKAQDPKNPDYQMARFKAATRKVSEKQAALDAEKNPDKRTQAEAELAKLKEDADNLKWGVQSLVEKAKAENEKKNALTESQVLGAIRMKILRGEKLTPQETQMYNDMQKPKTPNIKSVDLGDKVDIYENGVKVRTEKKGKLPSSTTEEKPGVVAERDRKAKRQEEMDVAKAETTVLANKGKQEAGAHVDIFNQYATKPYAYQWKKNAILPGGEWAKVKLPVINKKQVTAKDVYDTAEKHGLTYDEVLTKIMGQ